MLGRKQGKNTIWEVHTIAKKYGLTFNPQGTAKVLEVSDSSFTLHLQKQITSTFNLFLSWKEASPNFFKNAFSFSLFEQVPRQPRFPQVLLVPPPINARLLPVEDDAGGGGGRGIEGEAEVVPLPGPKMDASTISRRGGVVALGFQEEP